MCEELDKIGVEANCVVIADDENLDTAIELGFHTVESPNDFLGKKFNDGHEYGAKAGFEYLAPVGSDMFLDPVIYSNLHEAFISTNHYAIMRSKGDKFAEMFIEWGVLQAFPSKWTDVLANRPCIDTIKVGCDTYTRVRLKNRLKCKIIYQNYHSLECVSFQSNESQITSFNKLCETYDAEVLEGTADILLLPLYKFFLKEHVDQIVEYYLSGQSNFK